MTDPASPHYLDQAEAFSMEVVRSPGFHPKNRTIGPAAYTVSDQ
jgi:hypothetical protein